MMYQSTRTTKRIARVLMMLRFIRFDSEMLGVEERCVEGIDGSLPTLQCIRMEEWHSQRTSHSNQSKFMKLLNPLIEPNKQRSDTLINYSRTLANLVSNYSIGSIGSRVAIIYDPVTSRFECQIGDPACPKLKIGTRKYGASHQFNAIRSPPTPLHLTSAHVQFNYVQRSRSHGLWWSVSVCSFWHGNGAIYRLLIY